MPGDPNRSLIGAIAAHERWARTNQQGRREGTQAARDALPAYFERLVDPEGKLTPEERAVQAANARRAHLLRMTKLSVEARKAAKALREKEQLDAELAALDCGHIWPAELEPDALCTQCNLPYHLFSVPDGAA